MSGEKNPLKEGMTIFAIGLFLLSSALPAFGVDLDFSGDFRVRGFYTNNLTDQTDTLNDATAYNSLRFLLTASAASGLAKGVVTTDFTSTNSTGNQRFGESPSYGPQDRTFALLEAYLRADLRVVVLTAGRQMFRIGHGIIFDDPADGIFIETPLGPARLTLANLKAFDCSGLAGTANPAIAGACPGGSGTGNDTDFYLGNLSLRPAADMAAAAFLGFYKDRGPNILPFDVDTSTATGWPAGASDVELWILGGTLDGSLGPISFSSEIDYLWGELDGTSGTDLGGLNIQFGGSIGAGPADLGLTFLYASGQNPSNPGDVNINGVDGNFPVGLILTNGASRSFSTKDGTCLSVNGESLGGIPNCVRGSGLKAFKGTGSVSPFERLDLQGDVIHARASGALFPGGSTQIGWELDGTARYRLDDNLRLTTAIGYLIAGNFWKPSAVAPDPDNVIVIMAEVNYFF